MLPPLGRQHPGCATICLLFPFPAVTVNRQPPVPAHCRHCVHYYITHDARFPYGCRAMDFKSKRLPLQDVRDSTGRDCVTFTARAPAPTNHDGQPGKAGRNGA